MNVFAMVPMFVHQSVPLILLVFSSNFIFKKVVEILHSGLNARNICANVFLQWYQGVSTKMFH